MDNIVENDLAPALGRTQALTSPQKGRSGGEVKTEIYAQNGVKKRPRPNTLDLAPKNARDFAPVFPPLRGKLGARWGRGQR